MCVHLAAQSALALLIISETFGSRVSVSKLINFKKIHQQSEAHDGLLHTEGGEIESIATVVCSAFKAHAAYQQCGNPASLDRLGSVDDRVACAEACKRATSTAGQVTCCVFSDVGTCLAYVGSDHIIDVEETRGGYKVDNMGSFSSLDGNSVPAYYGSATVCSHVSNIGGNLNEDSSIWRFKKASSGVLGSLLTTLFATGDETDKVMTSGHGEALFRNIKPREIKQGQLGDCWLLAVIAAMARFPGSVRKLFLQQFRSVDGEYSIQLFNPIENRWVWVTIDDSVPTTLFSTTAYAKLAADHTTWVLLLEKAVAKFVDPQDHNDENRTIGYSKLIAGFTEFAMALLTGSQEIDMWRSKDQGQSFIKASKVDFVKGLESLQSHQPKQRLRYSYGEHQQNETEKPALFSWMIPNLKFKVFDLDDVWKGLLRGTVQNRIMTGSVNKKNQDVVRQGETQEADGLVGGHAYSILQAKEISTMNRVCVEQIMVTYTAGNDWYSDSAFMRRRWWLKGLRFTGATWRTSFAARHGVEESWSVREAGAFEGLPPSKDKPRKVVFSGVVDDFACDPRERKRTGRQTAIVNMAVDSIEAGTKLRFVQVRNPWGDSEMWTGAWSDGDRRRWSQHGDVAEILGFAPLPDGMWWMSLDDFVARFDDWSIGGVNMLAFTPNGHADCNDGFMMGAVAYKYEANGDIGESCMPAPCGLLGTVGDGLDCKCRPGFSGKITWSGSSPRGMCSVDAGRFFTDGSERLFNGNGQRIKCCISTSGKPTQLQDMNAKLPEIGHLGRRNPEGCGYMFGDTYHNGMKMKDPKCIVPIEEFMEVFGKTFEETEALFLH